MERLFPEFRSNYPSKLQSLADYVREKQEALANKAKTRRKEEPLFTAHKDYAVGTEEVAAKEDKNSLSSFARALRTADDISTPRNEEYSLTTTLTNKRNAEKNESKLGMDDVRLCQVQC